MSVLTARYLTKLEKEKGERITKPQNNISPNSSILSLVGDEN